MNELLAKSYFGNTVQNYLIALGIVIVGIVVVWIAKSIILSRLRAWAEKTETKVDNFAIGVANRTIVPLLYFGVFYLALQSLVLALEAEKVLNALITILLVFLGIRFLSTVIRFGIFDVYVRRQPNAADLENRFKALMPLITVGLWLIGAVFLLDNLGFEVSAVLAGLGIGGVAVALAASAVLGDLFAYVAIMLDKPFLLGDFIIVGDLLGSVEHIGIKTTRIRSLSGEQLIFSNKDLTDSRIRNFKRMERRRVLFKLGVTYDTPVEKLKELPAFIKEVITSTPETQFDRAHFSSFGDFNLVLEIVYYVLSPDYNKFMDIQQQINFAIKAGFEARGVEFAFPTQTLHVASLASPELNDATVKGQRPD